ncbi:inosine monophosphate dehydrogenase [Daldinia sp. FL1419]|nr:inosine monophosphate dehydrogenase [Daldinia sp. FL1419]
MSTAYRRIATMTASRMKSWFPTTTSPLIISAPMGGVTNIRLAAEVTKAGGLGFMQAGRDFYPGSAALKSLDDQLTQAWQLLNLESSKDDSSYTLPVGVGVVTHMPSAKHFGETVVPILKRHRPAAIWLFAPSPDAPETHSTIVKEIRSRGSPWKPKIAVQVGTVAAAREAVAYGVDIIVAQGIDAGGHQWASGAGIVSIVPEVADLVREFPDKDLAVWAAGGIADGRGVAAALALGAEGAVLGTRYMVAPESDAQDYKRKALISTSDGGSNTVKSQIHDHITGEMNWPAIYDGRAIVTPTYHDHVAGVPLDENSRRLNAAKDSGDVSRLVIWSGTGVGLIKKEQPAAEITKEVRDEAIKVITNLKAFL